MKLTPRTKEQLSIFGKNGLIITVSSTIIAFGVIFGVVRTWGQSLIVTPIVRTEVDKKVNLAKEDCQDALSKHIGEAREIREKQDKVNDRQAEVNEKILEKLSDIAETVAEIKGNVEIMKRRQQ